MSQCIRRHVVGPTVWNSVFFVGAFSVLCVHDAGLGIALLCGHRDRHVWFDLFVSSTGNSRLILVLVCLLSVVTHLRQGGVHPETPSEGARSSDSH